MHGHHRAAIDRVRTLVLNGLQHHQIRVPCDVRRTNVTTMPWRPLQVVSADVKTTNGLIDALLAVKAIELDTSGLCCMLMDVNIFWRTLRLVYNEAHVRANVGGALQQCVPVLGIWHAYAHCCKKVYQHFMPWWACLEIPGFMQHPEHSVVYTRPRLIVIEHLVMGVFLPIDSVERSIRTTVDDVLKQFGPDSQQVQQATGL